MIKWFKIVKNQYFGLWIVGPLLFMVQEIPYMLMPLLNLESNPVMQMPVHSPSLNVCEKIFGVLCVAVMMLIVNKDSDLFSVKTKKEIAFFCTAVSIIVFNFLGWILYFCGFQCVILMIVFIFALPPLYYLFIGLWRRNYFLVTVGSVFFAVHLANAFVNLF